VKVHAQYGLVCALVIGLIGAAASLFTDASGRDALLASALVALVVQLAAFAVARMLQPKHLFVGWGMGSAMRMIALGLYALVVAKLWQAPVMAALLSFAGFLFVTTLIEPLFLKR
jgi:hypothetical protein